MAGERQWRWNSRRRCRVLIADYRTNVLLVAMVFVHPTAVMQPREFAEMIVDGIPKATDAAEVLCAVVRRLPLGVEVAA